MHPSETVCPYCKAPAGIECEGGQPHVQRVRAAALGVRPCPSCDSMAWVPDGPPVDPLTVRCSCCLSPPGEQCVATSTGGARYLPHRLRGWVAAERLSGCTDCSASGWVEAT